MAPTLADRAPRGDMLAQIEGVGAELRRALLLVLEAVAGPHARPARVTRAIGLDKSLASRFVRAAQATTNVELMHIVPSPAGLRILANLAEGHVEPAAILAITAATERFQELLDATPGGRSAIDAQISESSNFVREKREHIAKQSAFKSMSFLLGHFCDVLTTSLFLVPSENGVTVDAIEIQRRVGLRRMRPSTPLPLLSFFASPEYDPQGDSVRFEPIDGDPGAPNATAFLLSEFSSSPMPELEVVHEGQVTTLVLGPNPSVRAPSQLSSASRVRNLMAREHPDEIQAIRGYVLHVPCRQLVRDVFVADSLFPGATPKVSFDLLAPGANAHPPRESGPRHFASVDLTASFERLPDGPKAFALPGVTDHAAVTRCVLERAGHGATRFNGWRCALTYPVPLVEMMLWLAHPVKPGQGQLAGR